MAAALADDVVLASPDLQGCSEVARLPSGQIATTVTHEQIIATLVRVEAKVEAAEIARGEFRVDFASRMGKVEEGVGDIRERIAKLEGAAEKRSSPTIAVFERLITLFERQPLLGVVVAVMVLGLGSGGVVALWEAVTR